MEFDDDYPLLHVPDLMLAVLRAAARGEGTVEGALALLRATLRAAHEAPPVSDAEIAERLEAARGRLAAVGLLETDAGGRFRLTALGRRVLTENPDGVDDSVLEQYVEPGKLLAWPEEPTGAGGAETPSGGTAPAASRQREYAEGAGAFREGRDITANPYPPDTTQHQAWEAGWCAARDEALGPLGG